MYEVTVRASDGNLVSTLDVEVTVTDMNESGVITGPATADYAENATAIVAVFSSTDPDGDGVTWSIAGTDAARFSISENGELAFKSPPDYEAPNDANTDNVYEVTVRASDGNLASTLDVEITVTDVNESGVIAGPATITYVENGTAAVATYILIDPEGDNTIGWTVAGTDGALFEIDGNGALVLLGPPNFENPLDIDGDNGYEIQILAVTKQQEVGMSVVVDVTDANDAPRFPSQASFAEIPENSCPGAHTIYRGIGGDESLDTDEDGDSLVYALSGPDVEAFVIHPPTGHVTLGPGFPLDFEGGRQPFTLRVAVSDGRDIQGNIENLFVADDYLELTVEIGDIDEAPVFDQSQLKLDACGRPVGYEPAQLRRSVISGSPGRTLVGAPVSAIDPEGKTASFSIAAQSEAGAFQIDSKDGQIMLAPDFSPKDARRVYTLRVAATDGLTVSHIEVRVEVLPAPRPTPEPEVEPPSTSRTDPTPDSPQPPKGTKDLPPQGVAPTVSNNSALEIDSLRSLRAQPVETVFVPVEGASQVREFGKIIVQDDAGRARLVAPAGTLASAYQVRLSEDSAECSQRENLNDLVTCVCISVEFFDASGGTLAQKTLNRAAALEIVLQVPNEMRTRDGDDAPRFFTMGSFEMMMRQDRQAEWEPTRLTRRASTDGSAIVTTEVRSPGQYMAVLSIEKATEGSSGLATPADVRNVPERAQKFSDVTVSPAPRPARFVNFVNMVAVAQQPMQHQLQPPDSSVLRRIVALLIALLFDVIMVLSAAAILHRLMFPKSSP